MSDDEALEKAIDSVVAGLESRVEFLEKRLKELDIEAYRIEQANKYDELLTRVKFNTRLISGCFIFILLIVVFDFVSHLPVVMALLQ